MNERNYAVSNLVGMGSAWWVWVGRGGYGMGMVGMVLKHI